LGEIKVFHKQACTLGEGLYYSADALLWLDIAQSKLMKKTWVGKYSEYVLPEQASAIWKFENDIVIVVSESGLCSINLSTHEWIVICRFPKRKRSVAMRANDGGCVNESMYLFGSMQKEPSGYFGSLYLTNGEFLEEIYTGIGIPNTFIKLEGSQMLVSDSFEKKMYIFDLNLDEKKVLGKRDWLDLSNYDFTPDGGCISNNGRIFIAMWNGACVNEYDTQANLIQSHSIPALRPTNCVLSQNEGSLYITSARDGMTCEELKKYPMSGSIFKVDVVT
jgi:sugar lactone lactonase YvrE